MGAEEPETLHAATETIETRDYNDFRYGLTVFEYEKIVDRLGLDAEQQAIADALHAELRRERFEADAEYVAARQDYEAWMRSMRDGTGPEDRKERLRRYTAIEVRLNNSYTSFIESDIERADAFFEDLRLVLRLDQIEDFEAALRWRIRHRQLRWGALPYMRLDLVEIADRLQLSGDLELDRQRFGESVDDLFAATLKRYEVELDEQLRRLIAIEAEHPNGARAHGRELSVRDFDAPDADKKWMLRFGAAAVRLAELQRKHVAQVGYFLTLRSRERLGALSREQAYPFAYGKTGPELLIERLQGRHDLTDAQREELRRLSDGYGRERLIVDEAWIRAVDALVESGDPSVSASIVLIPTYLAPRPESVFHEVSMRARDRDTMNREWAQRVWEFAARSGLVGVEVRMPHYYGYGYLSRGAVEEPTASGGSFEEEER